MSNQIKLDQHDHLLRDDADVAAIVIRERLRPVQGPRGAFFPPTFAAIGQGKKSDYHIDRVGPRGDDPEGAQRDGVLANRCTVDSVPSQANRLEARLLRYSGTSIPKVTISESRVERPALDLLEVGHRVADAVVRYSRMKDADGNEVDGFRQFEEALRSFVKGNAGPLARLAPTALVFGHWDSRDSATSKSTKSKARRLIRSEIVAYNVARATKRSQYWSSIDPEVNEELSQILAEAKEAASRDPETKNPASQLGMTDVPAPESPGGVIAFGPIERTTIISLSGLRALAVLGEPKTSEGSDEAAQGPVVDSNQTLALRRYLFALALASAADPGVWDLREGCVLVRFGKVENGHRVADPDDVSAVLVKHTGEEETFTMPTEAEPARFLDISANAFLGDSFPTVKELIFEPKKAKREIDKKRQETDSKQSEKKTTKARRAAQSASETPGNNDGGAEASKS